MALQQMANASYVREEEITHNVEFTLQMPKYLVCR